MLEWVIWLTCLRGVNHHLPIVSGNNETFLVDEEFFNVESFSWHLIIQDSLVVSSVLTKNKLTLISTHKDSSILDPTMGSVVCGEVGALFLTESLVMELQVLLLRLEEFICIVTGYKDIVGVHITE